MEQLALGHLAQTNVIESKPLFETDQSNCFLLIDDGTQSFRLRWANSVRGTFHPASLETTETYTFTVVARKIYGNIQPQLYKVQKGERVLYDREICERHNVRMSYSVVPIHYGLSMPFRRAPGQRIPTRIIASDLFPNLPPKRFPGGCIVMSSSPKKRIAIGCGECQEVYDEWITRK